MQIPMMLTTIPVVRWLQVRQLRAYRRQRTAAPTEHRSDAEEHDPGVAAPKLWRRNIFSAMTAGIGQEKWTPDPGQCRK